LSDPATDFMSLVCAAEPTRDTDTERNQRVQVTSKLVRLTADVDGRADTLEE